MNDPLQELARLLKQAQRSTTQGSYQRRAPDPKAVPVLRQAREGLSEYLLGHPQDADAWRLLSQAEECLLHCAAARMALERAMSLTALHDRRDLKRLALLRECEKQWGELRLSPEQLRDLGAHLDERLKGDACDHTLRFTFEWLSSKDVHSKAVVKALQSRGGGCDCEVLANVVIG